MKALFEVKTIENDWRPPFRKNIYSNVYSVGVSESFDRITGNGNDEPVFQLLEMGGDRALVKYSRLFTLKEPVDGMGRDKTLWVSREGEQTITYLWGEKGISKKIAFKGFAAGEEESAPESSEPAPAEPQQ